MLKDLAIKKTVYLVTGYTDLRNGIDGLAAFVQGRLSISPFEKQLFLFCGRRRDRIKDFFGKVTVFCFSTKDWITAFFDGLAMKRKQGFLRNKRSAGFWKDRRLISQKRSNREKRRLSTKKFTEYLQTFC